MNHLQLQTELKHLGTYPGELDADFGALSQLGFINALAAGPDTPLTDADYRRAAQDLGVPLRAVKAVKAVEAAGAGFQAGLPKILPEPHIFSKLTGRRFDATDPTLSYPKWDKAKYPKTQSARYAQLAQMVALDVDAGLSAASYGAFQILGANYAACGYASPWAMVLDQSLTEGDQLDAFMAFVRSKKLDRFLRAEDYDRFAEGYNGSAYRLNQYGDRLREAAKKFG